MRTNSLDLSMLMDFYELTMANGYFVNGKGNQKAAFDVFYRNNPDDASYSIFAGLGEIISYVKNLHFTDDDINYLKSFNIFNDEFLKFLKNFKFKGDIYSFKEGTIIYPNEPIITVIGTLIECQLLETSLLLLFNHESLIATKTNRIVIASGGRNVSDFGARRAHNASSAIYGAKASYIGGANSTATVLAGQLFNIPVSGTMAHSWVMSFDSEYEAFLAYAKTYPENVVLLIDTYDVLNSGIKNVVKLAKNYLIPNGFKLKGIRIDSGDLAYLSKKCRKILDANGLSECKIIVSNALDEYKILSLIDQGACVDSFGVGENLITSKSDPVFGGVYKLVALEENGEFVPKIKISATIEKITNPGLKEVYRVYSNEGKVVADFITIKGEAIINNQDVKFINPLKPRKKDYEFSNCKFKKLQTLIFKNGELVYDEPSINEIRDYVRHQINCDLWEEEKRFVYPHIHYLDFSEKFHALKIKLMSESKFDE